MTEGAHLLIVDDERAIAAMLDQYFSMEGYKTTVASDGRDALSAVDAAARGALSPIDLVLLDVNMPDMDGFATCKLIRERLACPIIFLTARVEDADQLDGFAAGGDDYVLKPFSLQVLGSRVRAHLARESRREDPSARVWFGGNLSIDYARRSVQISRGDGAEVQRLDLTRTEFDIVALLSKKPGRVYDRTFIYEQVWGWNADGDASIVREHVRRIRKKFAEAGLEDDPIETVWGVGYRWGLQ
ncbi:response regulator transcription factor [Collinsella tanakaei]|nr:response regulator transcription factor [Collinsella tanakaei]